MTEEHCHTDNQDEPDPEGYYANYEHYRNTLRLWFVSYGIGAPVLFVSNKDLYALLKSIEVTTYIVILFLLASFAQILNALINKWCNWYNYAYDAKHLKAEGRFYEFIGKLCKASWYDWATDFFSLVLLCVATIWFFLAIT